MFCLKLKYFKIAIKIFTNTSYHFFYKYYCVTCKEVRVFNFDNTFLSSIHICLVVELIMHKVWNTLTVQFLIISHTQPLSQFKLTKPTTTNKQNMSDKIVYPYMQAESSQSQYNTFSLINTKFFLWTFIMRTYAR